MTSPQNRSTHEADDPRLLLPEWLRDPADRSVADSNAGSSTGTASEELETQTRAPEGSPASPPGTPLLPVSNGWQQPPAAREGYFDPAALIGFDDLPAWMQRLQNTESPAQPTRDALAATQAAARVVPLSDPASGTPDGIEARMIQVSVNGTDDPDESFLRSESDLSPTRFVWITGTAVVLIIAAVLVLFL